MRLRGHLLCLAFLAAAPAALAADVTPGTYMLQGGSYMIEVEPTADGLVVHEPNKDSPYTRVNDTDFHFWNDNTQTKYGIRYVDERTIEAFKPEDEYNVPSTLVLVGGSGADAVVENDDSARWEALAMEYAALIETDPDNVQSWAACAGVAMKRSISTVADADAYAAEMAAMLQLMMSEGAGSPCPEVFTF